jgi:hypothetical protein
VISHGPRAGLESSSSWCGVLHLPKEDVSPAYHQRLDPPRFWVSSNEDDSQTGSCESAWSKGATVRGSQAPTTSVTAMIEAPSSSLASVASGRLQLELPAVPWADQESLLP